MPAVSGGDQRPGRPGVPEYEPVPLMLTCTGRNCETADVVTFRFAVEGPARFRYLPGQAVTLAVPVGGETLYRTFTIASPPTRADELRLTVKACSAGRATRWLHERLTPGMTVDARGPIGRFSLARHPARAVALISAGSGATPMIAMLRWLADRGETTDVAWVHAARTPSDVLFATELARLDAAMPGLRLAVTVSSVPPGASWSGYRGRIDRRMLAQMVPDLARREVFCCGPAPFMGTIARIHRAEGGPPERFHTESFGHSDDRTAEPPTSATPAHTPEGVFSMTIGARTVAADPARTILSTALASGIVIPTGCRDGICGTCRMVKRSGEVAMEHNGGLSAREERAGYVLACCTRPLTDLKLEHPASSMSRV